jgi:N-acetylglutamate synthase-like GNAT family acetyltransferase
MNTNNLSYTLSDQPSERYIDAIHALLKKTYWASDRTRDQVAESLRHSIIIFALDPSGQLVGCARAVTDTVTFAWICDVVVDEHHRGKGLGKQLMSTLLAHPGVVGTRKILVTKDAQGLYQKFGFKTHPFECMVKLI